MFIYRIFIRFILQKLFPKRKKKGYSNCMKGRFKCDRPDKYRGDPTNIIFRSSYEFKVMQNLDNHPDVIWWESEEFFISYRSPVDNRIHRYFIDFRCKIKDKDGKQKIYCIEVKPKYQTIMPSKPKKTTKRYISEAITWGVNQAKWSAAKQYCENNGFEFLIITEDDIFGKDFKWQR